MSADTIAQSKGFQPEQFEPENVRGSEIANQTELLAGAFVDKGFDQAAIVTLGDAGDLAGKLIGRYYLGNHPTYNGYRYGNQDNVDTVTQQIVMRATDEMPYRAPSYGGSIHENRIITEKLYPSYSGSDNLRDLRRNGAQREFRTGLVEVSTAVPELGLEDVPIAIVGAGAAGTLAARAFMQAGFHDVTVLDKRGEAGGIWNQANVHDGSKNNPFDIRFDTTVAESVRSLADPNGSGRSIQNFIHSIATGGRGGLYGLGSGYSEPVTIEKAIVAGIEPGDLGHVVHIKDGSKTEDRTYPIVVYAPGIGQPLPLSHPEHMTTTATRKEAGIRWQQQLTPEKLRELEGKRVVFIGAGNSTAEMAYQIQQHNAKSGRQIDYRIITHYPLPMVQEPDEKFADLGTIYRNTAKPELTKLAGDLPHIRRMYDAALRDGKIVGGIREWHVDNNKIVVQDRDGVSTSIPMDAIYTLTGYGQDPKVLGEMGVTSIDDYAGTIAADYDGEIQRTPGAAGRTRLYAGYFALGPIMKNKYNPNAIVIPGIQGQLNNLLTSAIIRATEYAMQHPEELAKRRAARLAKAADRAQAISSIRTLPEYSSSGYPRQFDSSGVLLERYDRDDSIHENVVALNALRHHDRYEVLPEKYEGDLRFRHLIDDIDRVREYPEDDRPEI
jgi:hypothetical protein